MSKSSNSDTQQGINRNDYSYEDYAIKAICEIYHSKYGTNDILTLPPVTGTTHFNLHSSDENFSEDVLRGPIVELALETKKKIGFCHLKEGGFHWVAVTLSKEENSNNIICNVLNSTSFKNHPDVTSDRMTEQEAEMIEGRIIFDILQPHLDKCLKDAWLNNFNIMFNEPGMPVYKQTENVGCGPNALENLRSALYDNQPDRVCKNHINDEDIRDYHEFIYTPLNNLYEDQWGKIYIKPEAVNNYQASNQAIEHSLFDYNNLKKDQQENSPKFNNTKLGANLHSELSYTDTSSNKFSDEKSSDLYVDDSNIIKLVNNIRTNGLTEIIIESYSTYCDMKHLPEDVSFYEDIVSDLCSLGEGSQFELIVKLTASL